MSTQYVRVLHVEDDRVCREVVRAYLSTIDGFDFELVEVDNEADAVAIFQTGGIDLVLLDYHLARGDGLNCLRRMRQIDHYAPIIAVSGTASPEIAAVLIEEGADDYLGKVDLNPQTLEHSVSGVLRRARGFRSRRAARIPQH